MGRSHHNNSLLQSHLSNNYRLRVIKKVVLRQIRNKSRPPTQQNVLKESRHNSRKSGLAYYQTILGDLEHRPCAMPIVLSIRQLKKERKTTARRDSLKYSTHSVTLSKISHYLSLLVMTDKAEFSKTTATKGINFWTRACGTWLNTYTLTLWQRKMNAST